MCDDAESRFRRLGMELYPCPRGPEVGAELTPLVPVSLSQIRDRGGDCSYGLFQPVEDWLPLPQVLGQLTRLRRHVKERANRPSRV